MIQLAEVVDTAVGGDAHRDAHALELVAPNGATVSTVAISNDDAGFTAALAWIAEHAPGPRIVIALKGTRSYGIGPAGEGGGLVAWTPDSVQAASRSVRYSRRVSASAGNGRRPTKSHQRAKCVCPVVGVEGAGSAGLRRSGMLGQNVHVRVLSRGNRGGWTIKRV